MGTLFNAWPRSLSAPNSHPPQSRAGSPTRLADRTATGWLVNHSQGQKTAQTAHLSRWGELWVYPSRLTLTEKKQLNEPPCSSSLLSRSKLLLPRRQPIGRAVVVDLLDLFTQTQLIKVVVQEQEPVASLARSGSRMTNPVQQFAGDSLDLCMAICFLLAEDMPDNYKQFPRNGDNRFLFANACGQALKLGFPMGVMLDGNPGRLNHDPAQITAPLLGDAPPAIGFPRLVDTGSQAGIAHEMLGRGKPGDLPNSGQDTQS